MPSPEAEARLTPDGSDLRAFADDADRGDPILPAPAGKPPSPWIAGTWSRLAIPLTTLAICGASLALFWKTLGIPPQMREGFLTRNVLGASPRAALLRPLLGGAAVPVLAALISLLVQRGRVVTFWEKASRVLAPVVLVGLFPALFNTGFGHLSQLSYLVFLSAFVLMCEPLARLSLSTLHAMDSPSLVFGGVRRLISARASGRLCLGLVTLAAAGYAAYVGFFTILNHHRLATTAFDLGIYDNLIFNAMHGHPFKATVLFGPAGGNNLASHAEFAVLLFVPFYAIHPGAETMLIIQAVVLGFAAVPLYLFASTALPRPTAVVIAVAYLLFAPLHGPNFYDFHWLPLAIFFHFWLYYAIATRKNWLVAGSLFVLLAIREDIAVGLAVLGLFLLLTGLRPRLGLLLAALSATWFGVDRFVIMPLAGAWYFQNFYVDLFADGVSSFGSVFKTILTNPLYFLTKFAQESKLVYVLHMFASLAFLPLRRLPLVLLALPGVFFTIMTTGYGPTLSISFQYTTHWIPYLFLATVLGLIVIARGVDGVAARQAAVLTLAVAMLSHSYSFGAILQQQTFIGGFSKIEFRMTPAEKQRYADLKELLAMIPPSASVAATEQETPHISARKIAYTLRWPPGPVDYLLVGRSHIGDLSRSSLNAALADPKEFGLLAERGDELFLFKRGFTSPQTGPARIKLGVP